MGRSSGKHIPTKQRASVDHYSATSILLHWTTFVLVIMAATLGILRDSWPSRQQQTFWINIHAILGLTVWGLVLMRLWWRTHHAPPIWQDVLGSLEHKIASSVHVTLYALLLITPIVGAVTFVFHGRVFEFGIFRIDPGFRSNRAIFHPTQELHGYLAYAIIALVVIHALAALWHQFYLRDGLIGRMWPAQQSTSVRSNRREAAADGPARDAR